MTSSGPIVTIDGPAGAGKSTVARRLAARLGFLYLDTGALYRAAALAAMRGGTELSNPEQMGALTRELVADHKLRLVANDDPAGPGARVFLADDDVSEAIRTPAVSMAASRIATYKSVRDALLELQRQLGRAGGVVVEGRDIGTVVFPYAERKFFLTASVQARAQRRYDELLARGAALSFEQTLAEVAARDEADENREVAPLCQAADATLVDSTRQSIDEVVDAMAKQVLAWQGSES